MRARPTSFEHTLSKKHFYQSFVLSFIIISVVSWCDKRGKRIFSLLVLEKLKKMELQRQRLLVLLWMVSNYWILLVNVVTAVNEPLSIHIQCVRKDYSPVISMESCNPSNELTKGSCQNLIRRCKCQHNIELKWIDNGVRTFQTLFNSL